LLRPRKTLCPLEVSSYFGRGYCLLAQGGTYDMVFWVIMGVAIGNLLLGFALAVFLNRRYQTLVLPSSLGTSSSQDIFHKGPDIRDTKLGRGPEEADAIPGGEDASGMPVSLQTELEASVSEPFLEEPSPANPPEEESPKASEPPLEKEEKTEGASPPCAESEMPSSGGENQELAGAEILPAASIPQENPTETQRIEEPVESVPSAEDGEAGGAVGGEPADASPTSLGSRGEVSSDGAEASSGDKPPKGMPETAEEKGMHGPAGLPPKEDSPRSFAESQPTDIDTEQKGVSSSGSLSDLASSRRFLSEASRDASEPSREGKTSVAEQKPVGKNADSEILDRSSGPSSSDMQEAAQGGSDAETKTESPSSANGLEASLERALLQWQREAAQYFEQLSRTRAKVQKISDNPKAEEIHTSLGEIHRAGQEYLTTARPAREALGQLTNLRSTITPMRDHLNTLAAKEETLIELTSELLPPKAGEAEGRFLCAQLLQHTDRLLEANQKVQTALEAARSGSAEETPAPGDSNSRPSGNGSFLEAKVREKVSTWWDDCRSQTHHLSLIILEIDDLSQLEEEYGTSLCKGLVRAIGKLVELEQGAKDLVIPLSGPRFAWFCHNQPMDHAVERAEHLRQSLAATRFYRRKKELRISVSCGVTEATREDTPESVLERAEATLLQARRYGKGRCFSHDGYFPMPVPQHPVPITPKEFEI